MNQTSNNIVEQTCLNCDYTIDENFCSHCGQKRFKRIDKKYVTDEIQYLLIHTNKGFLYTIKKLVKNPGKTAREFIDGNRVNHYKPLLLMFILSGISAFISFKIIGLNKVMEELYKGQHLNSPFMNDLMTVYSSYNSIIMLALIPVFALMTWIAFMKWKNNYYEHIVMNAYILSFQTIVNIVCFFPLLYILKNTAYFNLFFSLMSLVTPAVLIWFFRGFYIDKSLKQILWRVLAVVGLMMVAMFVLMIISAIGGLIYALIKGPEGLEYIKPRG
ncbi:DUF3667 domain-containing protein [Pedobacter ureilyticus]|uniref:DUF3667 domain-containing protein n=1 Tax=Pedobacter ureilyticus TaxID=1393051 RepID=A0ABW9J9F7_9SPHI|nr:DUF3667 domain-containing protein [Pedobacter helvus]